jgi:hypothetical protein
MEPLDTQNTMRLASGSDAEPCWWTAEVMAREVLRSNTLDPAVAALPPSVIKNGLTTSKLWVKVGWHKHGIGRMAVFDIGPGMRISVHAGNIEMQLIHPRTDFFSVSGNQEPSISGLGLYMDTIVASSVTCGCAPIRGLALLTQTFIVAGGATISVPIPPGAVGCQILIPGVPGFVLAGEYVEFATSGPLAPLNLLTIAAGRTGVVDRPGNASAILSTNTDLVARTFTYVWHLEL